MKKLLQKSRFMLLLVAMMTLSLTNAWGAITSPYTWTLASGNLKQAGGSYASGGVTWTYPSLTYVGFDTSKGAQIGSGSNPQNSCIISTPISSFGASATITKVTINASTGSKGNATYDICVGGVSMKSGSLTTTATNYATGALSVNSGSIEIKLGATAKAYYIKSITVEFTAGGSDPSISLSASTIDFGEVYQKASVDAKKVKATLANLTDDAIVSLKDGSAFSVTPTKLSESGDITITPNTNTQGEYTDTLFVSATGAADTAVITMNVVEAFVEEGVSFEQETSAYTDWTFNNFASKQSGSITAHKGQYYGTTDGKESGYMTTTNKVNPDSIKFFVSKQTKNTTSSSWKIQVSSDKSTWTDAKTVSATSMAQGTWVEVKEDLSKYTNVYVSIKYEGSSAVRNIDDVILTTRTLAKSEVILATCQNGSVSASVGESPISSGATVEEGATVTLGNTPGDGYKLDAYSVKKSDQSIVEVKDGKFTMPNEAVTVSATFIQAKVLNSVEITKQPTTKEFWKGDTFTSEGLELTAHFSTGDEVVTPTSISGYDMATPGKQTVTVSFKEGTVTKSDTYDITVKTIANTAETAYTVDSARKLIDAGKDLSTPVYVKGTISEIATPWSEQYNNISYNISDDGLTTSAQFMLYRCATNGGAVGDDVVAYGTMKLFGETYEFASGNTIVSINKATTLTIENLSVTFGSAITPVIVTNIEGDYTIAYESDNTDVVVVSGSTLSCGTTTGSANITATISATGYKGAETEFTVTVNPAGCTKLATISKGTELNGTFTLSVSGEQCADDAAISTVLTAVPNTHYHLASVTSLNAQEQTVGTIGEIVDNECTISGIEESTTVTAVFAEDAKGTATFAKGAEAATGTAPADIEEYVGDNITLPANTFTYTGYKFAGWSDGTSTYAAGASYEMPEGGKAFTATWEQISKWAYTYTSNVEVGSDSVNIAGTNYAAKKTGTSKATGSTTITVPAGSSALHFHAAGWNNESVTLQVSMGATVLGSFDLPKDAGMTGNGPVYTLANDPASTEYFMVALSNITEETTITFEATAGKRFAIYGVNAVLPAAVSVTPLSIDYGEWDKDKWIPKYVHFTTNEFVQGQLFAEVVAGDKTYFNPGSFKGDSIAVYFMPKDIATTTPVSAKFVIKSYFQSQEEAVSDTVTLTAINVATGTPYIRLNRESIDFGTVDYGASVADQSVKVDFFNTTSVNVSISGEDAAAFSVDPTSLTQKGNVNVSAVTTLTAGTYNATLSVSATGATTKSIPLSIKILSQYSGDYSSNVEVGTDTVIIGGENFEAVKVGTSKAAGTAVINLPLGTERLNFHAAGWNDEDVTLVLLQGEDTLAVYPHLYADAGVKSSSPFTLEGDNYATEQYFYYDFATPLAEATDVTFTTSGTDYRFVLYGVNQEGGIVPVLDSIKITGTAKTTTYEVGESFSTDGLKVMAYYSLEGVAQTPVPVTKDADVYSTPATFISTETTSVTVTAEFEGKSDNKEVAVTVTEPVPTISVNPTSVNFGTIIVGAQVADKNVAVTLSNIEGSASVTLAGEGAAKFAVTPASLSASGDITISATADSIGTYAATITISATDATPVEIPVSMIVEAGDLCDQDDDFATALAQGQGYTSITTTDGWSAANAMITTIGTAPNQYKFLTINGKTSTVGTITSPKFEHGISALKFRYTNTNKESNGVKIKIDFVQNDVVVKSDTLTKDSADVEQNIVYTETISNINIAGDYKIVFTNLSPSDNPSSNKDRVSIGRICITEYADFARTGLTVGKYGTLCLPKAVTAGDYEGFEAFKAIETDGKNLTIESVEALEAGKAYIIVPSAETMTCMFTGTAATAPVAAADNAGLTGTFVGTSFQGDGTQYVVANNKIMKAGNVTIGANKGWIIMSEVPEAGAGAPQRPGSRRISLASAESQVVTDLNAVGETKLGEPKKVLLNGQIIIIRDGKMFNAQGQIVK